MNGSKGNLDHDTVESFGQEWSTFDQRGLGDSERRRLFDAYFRIFPWSELPQNPVGMDIGCGSGRWAMLVAGRCGHLHCLDASRDALEIARRNLSGFKNISFHHASIERIPVPEASLDFAFSLGVLHHLPDTEAAIEHCVRKLKPGAPLLLYLYYAFDNRPWWFRMIWKVTDIGRRLISRLPPAPKRMVTDLLAFTVYWPLTRLIRVLERLGMNVDGFPLAYYRNLSMYTLRTDARDRFGTPLERRFTLQQIVQMMLRSGLTRIEHSDRPPYWCVVGVKGNDR